MKCVALSLDNTDDDDDDDHDDAIEWCWWWCWGESLSSFSSFFDGYWPNMAFKKHLKICHQFFIFSMGFEEKKSLLSMDFY